MWSLYIRCWALMYSQHAAELIVHTYITAASRIFLKDYFHPWIVCFWLPEERSGQGCPVRGIGDKCLLVIGHPTRLSSNIHAGDLGDFRECGVIGYSPIGLAPGKVVNVSAVSRLQTNSSLHGSRGLQEPPASPPRYRALHLNFRSLLGLLLSRKKKKR